MATIGRFRSRDRIFYGEVVGEEVIEIDGTPFLDFQHGKSKYDLPSLKILVPTEPSKIIAIGLNYAEHARETKKEIPKEPLMWLKAPSSLLEHDGTILIPHPEHRTDFEAELCIVIGKVTKNVSESEALSHVFGYTNSQDISDRHIQASESQWTRSKSFDSFTPVGPFIRTDLDPSDLRIQQIHNRSIRQDSRTSDMIFKAPFLVSFLSHQMTLLPGDLILTGTPAGIGAITKDDQLEVRIDGLRPLRNLAQHLY
jgi:2-keto-4-pentenoate hydratase/2-oxohepta-3-ene-1,7-dioic acid hydratase in catechol pathway